MRITGKIIPALMTVSPGMAWAADSYRWLHVTIDTPWAIFIFLLPMVLTPIILMAILYWRYAGRSEKVPKGHKDKDSAET